MSLGEYSVPSGLTLDCPTFLYPGELGLEASVGEDWKVLVEAFDTARVGGIGSAFSAARVGEDGLDFKLFFLDKIKSLGKLFFRFKALSTSEGPPVITAEVSLPVLDKAILSALEESPVSDSIQESGGGKVNFSLVPMCSTSRGDCSFKIVYSVQHYVLKWNTRFCSERLLW